MKETTPLLGDINKIEAVHLCQTLREELVESVSKTGGHLSSNLGTVELMVAIHRVFDTSTDRLVFDVGHQCYIHKMLTGRKKDMGTLRQWNGIAGFPKPAESIHDAFIAGHASNSVAVAVGMAQARNLRKNDYKVLALLGDGALTGGLAYEGLATGGALHGQLLIILNDNGMSIAKNVGGIAQYLSTQRLKPSYLQWRKMYRKLLGRNQLGREIHQFNHNVKQAVKSSLFPCSLFEQMGFTYYGPVDGHDVEMLTGILQHIKNHNAPVFLHVRTTKGKGYLPAQQSPDAFHGVAPFDGKTGKLPPSTGENFSYVFGKTLTELGKQEKNLCCITAAMPTGTGLDQFGRQHPSRLFDVGIAEGCATSLMAGLSKEGAIPVFAVYSTFLQRAYDMLLHDVALESLHCVIGVDRAGLVGEDGETHHGVFDVAFLSTVPNLTVLAPSSYEELRNMLTWSVCEQTNPVAIRYPRGKEGGYSSGYSRHATEVLRSGRDVTLVAYGTTINEVLSCADLLEQEDISVEVIKINVLSPLDWRIVGTSAKKTGGLLVVEEVISLGSVGQRLVTHLAQEGICPAIALLNLGNQFVRHGSLQQLKEYVGLTTDAIYSKTKEVLACVTQRQWEQ